MKSQTFNCDKCQDTGIIMRVVDGTIFAKNCECLGRQFLIKKLKCANIPKEFENVKVADFKPDLYEQNKEIAKNAKGAVKNYILGYPKYKAAGKGIYLYSKTKGSGKTMLSIALGNALINMHQENVKFITTIDLLNEIKKTYSKDSEVKESELLNIINSVDVLILDDIGTEKQSEWVTEILYSIFNTRLTKMLVTIFTSNVHISELKHDERIVSRIEKLAVPIQMPEESIRRKLAKTENMTMMNELLGL